MSAKVDYPLELAGAHGRIAAKGILERIDAARTRAAAELAVTNP